MRAVVTVIGKDMVGILSKVSGTCADCNANVIEVTQSVLQDLFAMIMLVDISSLRLPFDQDRWDRPGDGPFHPCDARGHLQLDAPYLRRGPYACT